MSLRCDTSSLISGALVCGNRGLGVTGAVVRADTATGPHGAGILYNDWDSAADDPKEFRALIVTPPGAGTFFAFEDGSFTLIGAPDATYVCQYRLFVDGADLGLATFTITIGAGGVLGASAIQLGELVAQGAGAVLISGSSSITLDGLQSSGAGTVSGGGSTIGRPVSDISDGAWLPSSVGAELYSMVDETVPDDADYIYTNGPSTCELQLSGTAFPGSVNQVFSFRAQSSTSSSIRVTLKQGVTVIATWTQVLTPTATTYSRALSSEEIALIGPGALSVSLEAL